MNVILCTREDMETGLSHGLILCPQEEAEDYLIHSRTVGSKNGIRLYQYKDGSLTPLGRIHYGVGKANRLSGKAQKYSEKAEKLEAAYDKARGKSEKATETADKKGTERSKAKAENREHDAQEAKLRMEEYRTKASIANQKAKEAFDKSLMKIGRAEKKKGDPSLTALREEMERKSKKTQKDVGDTLSGMESRDEIRSERDFESKVDRFDKLSKSEKQEVGNEILKRVHDFDSNPGSTMDKDQVGDLRTFLFDRINKNSGNWNTGESKSEGNKRAIQKMNKSYADEAKRIEEVKKEIDYVDRDRNEREHPFLSLFTSSEYYSKESKRLKAALKSDRAYNAIKEASASAEKDLCGAVLRDIGFNDTPENREMIFRYVFND